MDNDLNEKIIKAMSVTLDTGVPCQINAHTSRGQLIFIITTPGKFNKKEKTNDVNDRHTKNYT